MGEENAGATRSETNQNGFCHIDSFWRAYTAARLPTHNSKQWALELGIGELRRRSLGGVDFAIIGAILVMLGVMVILGRFSFGNRQDSGKPESQFWLSRF